ncbi:uncharacterized protein PFLUO_LOCUS5492 [Penicillium psychrofluorescens]|uniref:uncharacterized protein n=1 Tax=Penicillium psychrofluorescens TaxID=3158075 RepID=UPI003CCCA519
MFGLGNSNYQHYNKVAKDVDQMLIDLGAERVGPLGMGNDSKGTTEEDFVQWKDMGVRDLAHAFGFKETASIYKPMIDILPVQGLRSLGNVYRGEPHGSYLAVPEPAAQQMANPPLILPVVNAYGVSQKDVREFVHLEFSLDDFPSIQYDTGDYLRIWPLNPEDEVSLLIRLLDLTEKRDDIISITPRAGNRQSRSNLPTPTTIESLFRHYLDICGPVSPDFLIRLSEFLPELSFKQHVEMLCRDHDRFRNEVVLQRLRLTEVLSFLSPEECSAIPLSFVIENLKKLQPRSYSISSSSLVQPRRMAVTALVLSDRMPETAPSAAAPRTFKGVTTNYLLNLKQQWCGDGRADKHLSSRYMLAGPRGMLQSSKIFAQIRPSKFKLPTAHDTPIIMIGTGSGVAPFRAFLQERAMLKERGARVGKTVLFVGHRHPDEDFLYCNEWEAARLSLGDQFKLYTAFSRCDQQPKQYVQDVLKREIEIALEILANDTRGVMYICGSSAMANCVKTCVKKEYARLVAENGGLIDADAWLQNHKHAGRLLEDSWG